MAKLAEQWKNSPFVFYRCKCHEGEYMKTVFEHVLNGLCLVYWSKQNLDWIVHKMESGLLECNTETCFFVKLL